MPLQLKFITVLFILSGLFLLSCNDSSNECNLEPTPNIQDQQLHQNDIETIDNFLSNNNISAQTDPSGLRFVVNSQGSGSTATLCDNISVTFEGRLLSNGSQFDQASDPVSFPLNGLIVGWQIGIPKIQEGGSITLYIPSSLGFGAQSRTGIPANSNLIFDIELTNIN